MTWYHNNARGEKPQGTTEKPKHTGKGVKSSKRKYIAKGVAKDYFKHLILEHIQNLTDAKPGSPGCLKYYMVQSLTIWMRTSWRSARSSPRCGILPVQIHKNKQSRYIPFIHGKHAEQYTFQECKALF